jgi:integrase
MPVKWIKAAPGIRYYEHTDRRQKNGRPDRYYTLRCMIAGKRVEEGVGWATEGWTVDKIHALIATFKESRRTGVGPKTLAEMREANAKRRVEDANRVNTLTMGQFFDEYYLPEAKKRKRTWYTDKGRFDKIIRPMLGDYPVCGITKEHVEDVLQRVRNAGMTESTALQYMAVLRQLFNLAKLTVIDGKPLWAEPMMPVSQVRLPKALVQRERYLTYDESDYLLATLRVVNQTVADMAGLSLNTGLRFSEMLRLEWSDINFDSKTLLVRNQDMRKPGGRLPLNDASLAILSERAKIRVKNERHVFPEEETGKDGYPMRRIFGETVEECGLNTNSIRVEDKIVFHSLRHTFASWLAISGKADIYRIKTLMRHKSIKMTERYAHLLPDATREAVNHLRPR